MGCCLAALALTVSPRLVLVLLWLFTDRLTIAFTSGWIGILGFLFLPWTALAYAGCYDPFRGVSGFGWFIVILAFIVDLSSYGSSDRYRRRRYATA